MHGKLVVLWFEVNIFIAKSSHLYKLQCFVLQESYYGFIECYLNSLNSWFIFFSFKVESDIFIIISVIMSHKMKIIVYFGLLGQWKIYCSLFYSSSVLQLGGLSEFLFEMENQKQWYFVERNEFDLENIVIFYLLPIILSIIINLDTLIKAGNTNTRELQHSFSKYIL